MLNKMKTRYCIFVLILLVLAVGAMLIVYYIPFQNEGQSNRVAHLIQIVSAAAALIAAVVALALADQPRKLVNVHIEPSINNEDSGEEVAPSNEEHHRVNFKITNRSGFSLKHPVLTFRLPKDKKYNHPDSGRTFTTNLFNSQRELQILEFGDTIILSNSNLPYWNDKEELPIWIRMAVNRETVPFNVDVSINSENAEGVTEKVVIDPTSLLLNTSSHVPLESNNSGEREDSQ
jgi:hypothetical protein